MRVCRVTDMRYKEVINLDDGARLGYIYDIEFDIETGEVKSLIVPGHWRFLGLFGKSDDFVIPWDSITKIGDDIVLVRHDLKGSGSGRDKRRRIYD